MDAKNLNKTKRYLKELHAALDNKIRFTGLEPEQRSGKIRLYATMNEKKVYWLLNEDGTLAMDWYYVVE